MRLFDVCLSLIILGLTSSSVVAQTDSKQHSTNNVSRCLPSIHEVNIERMQCVQVALNNQALPSALIAAIRKDLWQYRKDFDSYGNGHRVFFADLNNDRVKEAILYPIGGPICSNRSCGIFIYTKFGNSYRKISATQTDRYSAVAGSRNEPSIGVLSTSNRGWRDLATRFFDYQTRSEKWLRVRYGSRGYTDSSSVVISTPRTILEYSSGVEVDFSKILAP